MVTMNTLIVLHSLWQHEIYLEANIVMWRIMAYHYLTALLLKYVRTKAS